MAATFPTQSQVVIVGGGIIGCSIAYHLAKLGWTDVVVLERGELTCGTTWHAAGLVTQLRATHTMTELCRYGPVLYGALKEETGQDTGFKQNGSLQVARTPERLTEIARMISLGKVFDVEARMVDPAEAKALYPLLDESRVLGGGFIPGDGQTNPIDTTMALAKGARAGGVRIIERVSVTGFQTTNGAVTAVETDRGTIACQVAVNCAGIWSREIGAMAGVNVPLYARRAYVCHHRARSRDHPRSAGPARHRRLCLCQGRRRQVAGRCVRARRQVFAIARAAGRNSSSANCKRIGTSSNCR